VYTLRPASGTDYAWLRRLHHAAMRELVERVWGWDEAFQDAYFREHFDPSGRQIVQVAGVDVGVIKVLHQGDELFLAEIQIMPAHQGHGLGSALIRDLQDRARLEGLPVGLQVTRANRARVLYERLGFVITGETATHYLMRWTPNA
jgi:GNAT superfamily N-acetyltransferase